MHEEAVEMRGRSKRALEKRPPMTWAVPWMPTFEAYTGAERFALNTEGRTRQDLFKGRFQPVNATLFRLPLSSCLRARLRYLWLERCERAKGAEWVSEIDRWRENADARFHKGTTRGVPPRRSNSPTDWL